MFAAMVRNVPRASAGALMPALGGFGVRGWLVAAGGGIGAALLMGIPTVMFENPWFQRMTPTRPRDYVFWIVSSILLGLIAGTYVRQDRAEGERPAMAGGLLASLAIGCPVCNKIVVLLIGASGALTYFGPAQIVLGAVSVALLVWTLLLRAEAVVGGACALPART